MSYFKFLSICLLCCMAPSLFISCKPHGERPYTAALTDTIAKITSEYPAEIGVALIVNGTDTVAVNDSSIYPMMSVFKVHQALAICRDFDRKGISLDTVLTITRSELDPHTWSPMMKEHTDTVFTLPVSGLLRYTLTKSDNNASNLMFKALVGTAATDSFIATVIPRPAFQIAWSEEDMSADHSRAYANRTSPLGAAILMERIFTDSLVSAGKQAFIRNTLKECMTGTDRIAAGLPEGEGITIAHKTGSGYINADGILAAHNDVAYIALPNGTHYTLAVFVKDFKGNEKQPAEAIERISAAVYTALTAQFPNN